MCRVFACGYNGFRQMDVFPSDFREDGKMHSCQDYPKPFKLATLETDRVLSISVTWSRCVVTLIADNDSVSTHAGGYSEDEGGENSSSTSPPLNFIDMMCEATTDSSVILKSKTSPPKRALLRDGSSVLEPVTFLSCSDSPEETDICCIQGGHTNFYTIFNNINFGCFACPLKSLTQEENEKEPQTEINTNAFEVKLSINFLDAVVPIKEISCGKEHVLLLSATGGVYSYGLGSRGQLGHSGVEEEKNPSLIEALEGVKMVGIAAGGWHSSAISEFGDLYQWGWNESGQLGLPQEPKPGMETDAIGVQTEPHLVSLPEDLNARKVVCGSRHTVVLSETRQPFSCGSNTFGQLGLGHKNNTDALTEIILPDDNECTDVFAGQWMSFFVCSKRKPKV